MNLSYQHIQFGDHIHNFFFKERQARNIYDYYDVTTY